MLAGKTKANVTGIGDIAKTNEDTRLPCPLIVFGIKLSAITTVKIIGIHAPANVPITTVFRKARMCSF